MFKMKLLAAVAAFGLSGVASAGINGSATGNTELVFTAYVGNVGYTYDLADAGFNSVFGSDVKMDSLIGSGNQTSNNAAQLTATTAYLTNGFSTGIVFDAALTGFDSFLSLAGGSTDGVLWNVWSGENSGVSRIVQTVASDPTARVRTNTINGAVSQFAAYTDANNKGGTHNANDTTVDGYRVTTVEDLTAFAGNVAPRLNVYDSFGSVGDTMDLYVVRGASPASNTSLGGFAQLLGATDQAVTAKVYVGDQGEYRLQIAVVPEPETYAMLLAGLGLIGFAARRRA